MTVKTGSEDATITALDVVSVLIIWLTLILLRKGNSNGVFIELNS